MNTTPYGTPTALASPTQGIPDTPISKTGRGSQANTQTRHATELSRLGAIPGSGLDQQRAQGAWTDSGIAEIGCLRLVQRSQQCRQVGAGCALTGVAVAVAAAHDTPYILRRLCADTGQIPATRATFAQFDAQGVRPFQLTLEQAQSQAFGVRIDATRQAQTGTGPVQTAFAQRPSCTLGHCQRDPLRGAECIELRTAALLKQLTGTASRQAGESAPQYPLDAIGLHLPISNVLRQSRRAEVRV